MSFIDWQYAFVNGMPLIKQKVTYEKYIIPESKTVARGGLTSTAKVDYTKAHAPCFLHPALLTPLYLHILTKEISTDTYRMIPFWIIKNLKEEIIFSGAGIVERRCELYSWLA